MLANLSFSCRITCCMVAAACKRRDEQLVVQLSPPRAGKDNMQVSCRYNLEVNVQLTLELFDRMVLHVLLLLDGLLALADW